MLGPFGILGWIRTGNGIHNSTNILRFRIFFGILTFLSNIIVFLRRIQHLSGAFLGSRPPLPGPIPGPIPCQIAFAYALPDAYAHAMPRAGPGRPAHAPPHVRGPGLLGGGL